MDTKQRRTHVFAASGAVFVLMAAALSRSASAAPGDPLGPSFTVASTVADARYLQPAVARNAGGVMVVVWRSGLGILARRLNADGTPAGTDFLVDASPNDSLPDVAMAANGDFVVSWPSLQTQAPAVYARRYHADGTPFGAAINVSGDLSVTTGETALGSAVVAMDDMGNFVVAWRQGHYLASGNTFACSFGLNLCTKLGGYTVRLRRYGDGGTTAAAVQTVDTTADASVATLGASLGVGNIEDRVSLAMSRNGASIVVAWDRIGDTIGLLPGVYARRYDANGNAQASRLVSLQVNNQGFPAVAIDERSGEFIVAYRRRLQALGGNGERGIFMRRYPASALARTSAEQRVDDAQNAYPDWPAVATDAGGNFVVTWAVGSAGRINAQRYASGGGALGINFGVALSSGAETLEYADVAKDASGDFVVVWDVAGIGDSRIDARLYDGP